MNAIQIFDPALCCNTGVCGVDVEQALVSFSADIAWAKENGAQIERSSSGWCYLAAHQKVTIKDDEW